MPRKKKESALVTEKHAFGNQALDTVVNDLIESYVPRRNVSVKQFRQDHVAMIENTKSIYVWIRDRDGKKIKPQMLFRAGWYLSLEENHLKEEILKDKDNLELNEEMWKHTEKRGGTVEKRGAVGREVKVVT